MIGIGDGEIFAASDMTPIIEHTERAMFLEDGDIASLNRTGVEVFNREKRVARRLN